MFAPRDFEFDLFDGLVNARAHGAAVIPRANLFEPAAQHFALNGSSGSGGAIAHDTGSVFRFFRY